MRMLIADKSPVFRSFLGHFLYETNSSTEITLCTNAEDVLERYSCLEPDIILMDMSLEGSNALQLTTLLRKNGYRKQIILMSLFDTAEYESASLLAGANAFVGKSDIASLLMNDPLFRKNSSYTTV